MPEERLRAASAFFAEPPPELAAAAVGALGAFPPAEVRTYLNTLWLQDPERWQALAGLYSPLAEETQSTG